MILLFIADGRSIHTQRWAEYFAGRGHHVHLITYDPMNRTIPGVTEYVLGSFWKSLYLAFIPRQVRINRIVRDVSPDIIHAHFIAKYGFHLWGLGFHPAVVSAWGDDVLILPKNNRLIRYVTRNVLIFADLVYAVSRNIRNHILSDFAILPAKVRYLPFGIDTEMFRPDASMKEDDNRTIRVFSNRGYYPVYDNGTLVRGFALAIRKEPRLRLTLKGSGPEEQAIRDLVHTLGLSESISFREKTDYTLVPRDYQKADIFITTSLSDGTPVSVLEAMASGLACICTSVGGIPEWIEHNRTGLLIKPASPDLVSDAILALAADPVLRERLGTAARETVVRNGQWELLMEQAEKDYQELVKTYRQDHQ